MFEDVRVARAGEAPPPEPDLVDVALLDMHHGWPNLGRDAIVDALQHATAALEAELDAAGLRVRVLSYDVRRGLAIPEAPGMRHLLYVGSGGPGHLDPRRNDGVSPGSQGILENPAWEVPVFSLFDRIRDVEQAALIAVCHTFGVMCRWLGVAEAVERGPEKGGKSAGIVENILTDDGVAHPWFGQLARALPDGRRFHVLDNRLYDLLPLADGARAGATVIGREALGPGAPEGDALTMIEAARMEAGGMPRIFGVNHHPEIGDRPQQLAILRKKFDRGDVSAEWYAERARTLTQPISDQHGDRLLRLTAEYTFLSPLRFHLRRVAALRAKELGRPFADPLRRPV
jgi:hypothetical protein